MFRYKSFLIFILTLGVSMFFILTGYSSSLNWQEIGSFGIDYTAATASYQSGAIQLVVGFYNGLLKYYNPHTLSWVSLPVSQDAGTEVTSIWCDWSNTLTSGVVNANLPSVLVGYADGSVYFFQPNSSGGGFWNKVGTQTLSNAVVKLGDISINSDGSLASCIAETAKIPDIANSPADYTNIEGWTYQNKTWSCYTTGKYGSVTSIDMNDSAYVTSEGYYSSPYMITPLSSGPVNILNGTITSFLDVPTGHIIENQGLIGYGDEYCSQPRSNVTYLNLPNVKNNLDYISAGDANRSGQFLYVIANGELVLGNIDTLPFQPNIGGHVVYTLSNEEIFNGLDVLWVYNSSTDWDVCEYILAGLSDGKILAVEDPCFTQNMEVFDAPANFPSPDQEVFWAQTFPSAANDKVTEIFNNENGCYICAAAVESSNFNLTPVSLSLNASGDCSPNPVGGSIDLSKYVTNSENNFIYSVTNILPGFSLNGNNLSYSLLPGNYAMQYSVEDPVTKMIKNSTIQIVVSWYGGA